MAMTTSELAALESLREVPAIVCRVLIGIRSLSEGKGVSVTGAGPVDMNINCILEAFPLPCKIDGDGNSYK